MLSLEIMQNRWKLFGHVLRSQPETPAQKAINYYFKTSSSKKFRGRPVMTLPNSLHNDIITLKKDKKFKNKYNNINQLKSFIDLKNSAGLLVRERQSWMTFVNDIYVAAKAERNLYFLSAK
eukprot:gene15830-7153_t